MELIHLVTAIMLGGLIGFCTVFFFKFVYDIIKLIFK